ENQPHWRRSPGRRPLLGDTARCLEWFVADSISSGTDLFVINGDLTTYKATIKERNLWIDRLIEMANHAPVVLVAGNHGRELGGGSLRLRTCKGETRHLPLHRAGVHRARRDCCRGLP